MVGGSGSRFCFSLADKVSEKLLGKEGQRAMVERDRIKEESMGWGFSSVVERLPRKRKALGSVPSSEKKKKMDSSHTCVCNTHNSRKKGYQFEMGAWGRFDEK